MTLHFVRHGEGPRLLLVHGLGGTWRSWITILPALSTVREVTAIDLPGHGQTPAAADSGTFAGLADSVERFILERGLDGIDIVGSSLGARIVLEMARRGKVGATVALDPGGFWRGWERTYFRTTLAASIRLLRGLRPALPSLSRSAVMRSALLAQLSARPWSLDGEVVAAELQSFASTKTFDALVRDLATGPEQKGPAADPACPLIIGWGRQDRLCLPRQAARAQEAFPSAKLHWFSNCGHFPMWDRTDETVKLILETTGSGLLQASQTQTSAVS
ncbi:MAG TPA: alpha/beta fold hydrolase [Bosea sp. (in: a-proteobacteria)]|uniref:alpha/beta fold hydrolase n=1 Tax=Bosea sp. (in: a-proteobacteria) TaxID=1871050 RepID=UPI002DDD33A8|nr:alpha/beta fold hydrolase [Bosea sp. (in: a-proteobacteria)]HEV2555458.1 alpha/beta fold hydrolase [Bosea sp. (in: a-proteobacteria)]